MSSPFGPFDEQQVAQLQSELGTSLDYEDLAARYERLEEDVDAVITEVLRIRLADINSGPTSFAIPGEYQQDATAQQKALQARLGMPEGAARAMVQFGPSIYSEVERVYDTEEAMVRRVWIRRGHGR